MHPPCTPSAALSYIGALCALLCSAISAHSAGWDTNVWPAYAHPRDTHQQLLDCYNALQERRRAIQGLTNNIGLDDFTFQTNDYRRFRNNMDNLRSATAGLVDNVYVVDPWAVSNSTLNDYFSTNFGTSATAPLLTTSQCCVRLNLPTNFFRFYQGPYRVELSGLGGHTDETATIGHAHGYTNAFTVAGGPNLPAGRTNWYTTDYGLDNLRAVLTNIRYTVAEVSQSFGTTAAYRNAAPDHDDNWAEAKTWAEANEVYDDWYEYYGIGTFGWLDGTQWFAYWVGQNWLYNITLEAPSTNSQKTVTVYQWANRMQDQTNSVFDSQGYNVRSNVYTAFLSTNMAYLSSITSTTQGMSPLQFSGLSWCTEPTASTISYPRQRGFDVDIFGSHCFGVADWTFDYR